MKVLSTNFISIFFLLFFIALSFAHSRSLADMDLAPRLFVLCIFNLISGIAIFKAIITAKENLLANFKTPLFLIVAGWVLTICIAYFKSINNGDAWFEVVKILNVFSLLVLLVIFIVTKKLSVKWIAISSVVATLVTICYTLFNIYIEYNYAISKKEVFYINYTIFGNHCNKNPLAEFLLLSIPLNALLLFEKERFFKIIAVISIIAAAMLILLSKSASVIIAFGVVSIVIVALLIIKKYNLSRQKITVTLCIAFIALAGLLSQSPTVKNRVSLFYHYTFTGEKNIEVSNNNSTFERMMMWKNSWQMIKDEPLAGIGLYNWKILFPKYGYTGAKYLITDSVKFTRPHNDYLQYWAEAGLISFLLFAALFIYSLFLLMNGLFKQDNNAFHYRLVLIAGLLAYAIICMFSYTSERPFNLILLIIYLSLIIVSNKKLQAAPSTHKLPVMLMAVCCILLSGYGIILFKERIKNELIFNKALAYKNKKDFAGMLRTITKINTENFPVDYAATPVAWYKATAYFANDKIETAKEYYDKAVLQAPYHVQVLTDAGVAAEKVGDQKKAEAFYVQALSINENFPQVKLNMAALKYNQAKITEAYDALRNFPPKSLSKKTFEQMTEFKKTFLVALSDSAFATMKLQGMNVPDKEKIFYQDLLKADSIAEKNGTPIIPELVKVFAQIK